MELWQASDYRWRELFEGADVMSEGATRDEPDDRSQQRTQTRTSPVAAVSRSATGVTKVRLTQSQISLAKKFGITPQQYAQEVAKLDQERKNG